MKNLKSIRLYTENGEVMAIPAGVAMLQLDDIVESIAVSGNVVAKNKTANYIRLVVEKDKTDKITFETPSDDDAWDRLWSNRDIAYLNLMYDDDSMDAYMVPWQTGEEDTNRLEEHREGPHYYLIVIDREHMQ